MRSVSLAALVLTLMLAAGCGRPASSPAITAIDAAAHGEATRQASGLPAHRLDDNTGVRLQILDFDGIQRLIASKKGRVVVLNAWSTSCEPCIREFPQFLALGEKYDAPRVACISLSFDYEGIGQPQEQFDRVLGLLQKQHSTVDNVLSSEESDILYHKFKLASVPAVFVYDQEGRLRKRFDNEHAKTASESFTYEDVERIVAELIGNTEPARERAK